MKTVLFFITIILATSVGLAQTESIYHPTAKSTGFKPDWSRPMTRAAVDTCGPYFNNYLGLVKTTDLYFEELRTGNASDFEPYAGRGQRFHANQPIEISGLQFYSFQNNPLVDSLMVVTLLYDYDEAADSIGVELARDTVWVKHTAFTPVLPEIEVNSYFDVPVTVTEDYIVALYTSTNDSLKIITNSAVDGDGGGEGVSFAYYNNPVAPSYTGWYATLPVFGPSYDLDYLINPLVQFKLHNDFTLSNDSICPTIVSATCADYDQVPNFSDPHYNRFYASPNSKIVWTWGDGLQNTMLTSLCHTYAESGAYSLTLKDTLRRHSFTDFSCAVELTKTIVVLDSIEADASFTASGIVGTFTNLSSGEDSVFWDFGDGSPGSTADNVTHTFPVGTFDVWFYAYGPCNTDSLLLTMDASDVGLTESHLNWSIYPNPANNEVSLIIPSEFTQLEILNTLGELIISHPINQQNFTLSTLQLAEGTYFIRLTSAESQSVKKLVIQH